jgi:multidrug resistance efflux pump
VATRGKIPIPLSQRWRSFRHSMLPILAFAGSLSLVALLWYDRHAAFEAIRGKFYAYQTDVISETAGQLLSVHGSFEGSQDLWLYTRVRKGDLIARLDSQLLDLELAVLRSELDKLRADVNAVIAEADFEKWQLILQQAEWKDRLEQNLYSLAVQRAQTQTQLALANIDLAYRNAEMGIIERVPSQIGPSILREHEWYRAVASKSVQEHTRTLDTIAKAISEEAKRIQRQPTVPDMDVDKLIEPIHQELKVQEKRILALAEKRRMYEVRAPMDGVITAIHRLPGQAVQPGESIVTIASDEAPYVVAYIPTDRMPRPDDGWLNKEVDVRFPTGPKMVMSGQIVEVGPQVELVPPELLRDQSQQIQEWGLPVAIRLQLSEDQRLRIHPRPGELVFVSVKRTNGAPTDATGGVALDGATGRQRLISSQ